MIITYLIWLISFLWLSTLFFKSVNNPNKPLIIDIIVYAILTITLLCYGYTAINFKANLAQNTMSRDWLDSMLSTWMFLFLCNIFSLLIVWVKLLRPPYPPTHIRWLFVFTSTIGFMFTISLAAYV